MLAQFDDRTAEQILNEIIDWYMAHTDQPLIADAWIILSEEQFVNTEAARLILEATERMVEFSRFALRWMWTRGLLPDIEDPEQVGEAFGYAFRGVRLEFVLRRHHGLSTTETRKKCRLCLGFSLQEGKVVAITNSGAIGAKRSTRTTPLVQRSGCSPRRRSGTSAGHKGTRTTFLRRVQRT